jgi:hypothetical protein
MNEEGEEEEGNGFGNCVELSCSCKTLKLRPDYRDLIFSSRVLLQIPRLVEQSMEAHFRFSINRFKQMPETTAHFGACMLRS